VDLSLIFKLEYAELNLELSQDFQKKAELKFESGDVAKVEALRARVETSKAAKKVRVATNEVDLAKACLNYLMARKKHTPLEVSGKLKKSSANLNLEEFKKRAFAFRPDRISQIHIRIGDWVKKGQKLVTLQSEEVGSAKSEFYKAQTDYDLANINCERAKRLFDHGAGAEKDYLACSANLKYETMAKLAMKKSKNYPGTNPIFSHCSFEKRCQKIQSPGRYNAGIFSRHDPHPEN
jgi:hypothetical protein